MRLVQAHPDWLLGFVDETWWSRFAPPNLSSWCEEGQPLRLVEQKKCKEDPDPQALACYGLLAHWEEGCNISRRHCNGSKRSRSINGAKRIPTVVAVGAGTRIIILVSTKCHGGKTPSLMPRLPRPSVKDAISKCQTSRPNSLGPAPERKCGRSSVRLASDRCSGGLGQVPHGGVVSMSVPSVYTIPQYRQ